MGEWLFTHEGDRETESRMFSSLIHRERPLFVFRVIRSALDNIEANYRYVKRETGNVGDWNQFVSEKVKRYRNFHRYWDSRCKAKDAPCCMSITYEDMQDEAFLRRALMKVLETWMSPALSTQSIREGVNFAVDQTPPKHFDPLLFPSGNRFTAAHYIALISTPSANN